MIAELLGILALRPGRTFHRDELVEILWPEVDPAVGRNRLRYALASLRKLLEPVGVLHGSVLSAGRSEVCMNAPAFTTDVAAYEAALAVLRSALEPNERYSALSEAVAMYGGPFMAGYYPDWALDRRISLAETFTTSACELAALALGRGEIGLAVDTARRAVEADPFCEPAHQQLIAALLAVGDHTAAVRQYRQLETILSQELGMAPTAATRALIHDAGTKSHQHAARPTPTTLSPRPPAHRAPLDPSQSIARIVPELPSSFTRFVGRDEELSIINTHLVARERRLITLTGPGGIGKTRLALEAVERLAKSKALRIAYVNLVDCAEARLILDGVMNAIGQTSVPGSEPLDQIAECVATDRMLVVLDNFEHLLEPGRAIVQRLLARIHSLNCLVTSRLPLELPGECVFTVSPLPTPSADASPIAASESASVQLFVDRAQLLRPDFSLTSRNAAQLAAISRQLEGIPLATELAASWVGTLSLSELEERLRRPLELLVSHRKDFSSRHRTIRRVLVQSYELLSPRLQAFFPRLAVFRGGWTLQAAEALFGTEETADLLDELRRANFVTVQVIGSHTRFRLLEVLREFAEEQQNLTAQQDVRLHALFYRNLGTDARNHLDGPEANEWLESLSADEANLGAAADRCLANGEDVETGVWLAEALWSLWQKRGYRVEQCRWLAGLLDGATRTTGSMRARALACMGFMARAQGQNREAFELLLQAVDLLRQEQDDLRLGFNLCHLGQLAQLIGSADRFITFHEESLEVLRRCPHPWGVAMTLGSMGNGLSRLGRHDEARRHLLDSVAAFRKIEDATATATTLGWLADAHFRCGNTALAEALARESLSIRREQSRPRGVAHALITLSRALTSLGQFAEALTCTHEALALFEGLGDLWGIGTAMHCQGVIACRSTDPNGEVLLRKGLDLRARLGDLAEVAESMEAIVVHLATGSDPTYAMRLIAYATNLREFVGMPVIEPDRASLGDVCARAKERLGDAEFEVVFEEGRHIALEEALACAHDILG